MKNEFNQYYLHNYILYKFKGKNNMFNNHKIKNNTNKEDIKLIKDLYDRLDHIPIEYRQYYKFLLEILDYTLEELLVYNKPLKYFLKGRKYISKEVKKLHQFLIDLFNHHSRIIPIEIMLRYKEGYSDKVGVMDIKSDLFELLRMIENNYRGIGLGKIGHYWRLEDDIDSGLHIHLLLIYDGKVKNSYMIGSLVMEICRIFREEITNRYGIAYSTLLEEEKLVRDRVGINDLIDRRILGYKINHYDIIARMKLFQHLIYYCKQSYGERIPSGEIKIGKSRINRMDNNHRRSRFSLLGSMTVREYLEQYEWVMEMISGKLDLST